VAENNDNMKPVCHSTVERFVKKSEVVNRSRRLTEKTGKKDPEADWPIARLSQCCQFMKQLNGVEVDGTPRMFLHAIVFFDENHKKVFLYNNILFVIYI